MSYKYVFDFPSSEPRIIILETQRNSDSLNKMYTIMFAFKLSVFGVLTVHISLQEIFLSNRRS